MNRPAIKSCRRCGEPVRWATTLRSQKSIPLNPEPDPKHGTFELAAAGAQRIDEGALFYLRQSGGADHLYRCHLETCGKEI